MSVSVSIRNSSSYGPSVKAVNSTSSFTEIPGATFAWSRKKSGNEKKRKRSKGKEMKRKRKKEKRFRGRIEVGRVLMVT
jgi:hypothetical protein